MFVLVDFMVVEEVGRLGFLTGDAEEVRVLVALQVVLEGLL